MNIIIEEAKIKQKNIIENLLELYNYDFTEFIPDDVNGEGKYGYEPIKYYWNEDGRHAFIIYIDGKIAGFVLIRVINYETPKPEFSVAEFFIMKKYRYKGIGKKVAFDIFDKFHGCWEVSELSKNIPAQKFWRKVIKEYTNSNYVETVKSGWDGPVQKFSNN